MHQLLPYWQKSPDHLRAITICVASLPAAGQYKTWYINRLSHGEALTQPGAKSTYFSPPQCSLAALLAAAQTVACPSEANSPTTNDMSQFTAMPPPLWQMACETSQ